MFSLGAVQFLYREIIAASIKLGRDADRRAHWQDSNDFGMMFVMAVRAGYRPDRVMKAIKGWKPEINGIVSQNRGGGIETAGIIEAINNMLMQSPFDGSCITVTRADNQQPVATVQNEQEFTFGTTAGVTYNITRAECTPAATLWDIGSAYRCVVSNSFGTARSNPGIMNPNNVPTVEATDPILGRKLLLHDQFAGDKLAKAESRLEKTKTTFKELLDNQEGNITHELMTLIREADEEEKVWIRKEAPDCR